MKIDITNRQCELIREALETYYYRFKDEGDREKMDEITELETLLIKHTNETTIKLTKEGGVSITFPNPMTPVKGEEAIKYNTTHQLMAD